MDENLRLAFEEVETVVCQTREEIPIQLGRLSLRLRDVLGSGLVERERLEYKRGWNPEEVLHAMCAYANDFYNYDGGYLVIGIETTEEGAPILPPAGVSPRQLDKIGQELTALGCKISPHYHPVAQSCEIEGRTVLVLKCPGGEHRPYKAPIRLSEKNKESAYFIRRNSCTMRVTSQEDERELVNLANKIPHDDRRNRGGAQVSDLERRLLLEHLERVGSDLWDIAPTMDTAELGLAMNIVRGAPEERLPINVGLMFFNSRPDKFFPQTQIDVVQFLDGVAGDRIIEKTFVGPIGKQLTDALDYLKNSVLETLTVKVEGRAQAQRVWNYPFAALEEILPNAVYHRSYETRVPIEVRVESHQITVVSQPGPHRSIDMDDLRAGRLSWRPYLNRRIGEFLKELELTEGRSTGIPKVIRAMRANGSPTPDFQTNHERDYFIATLPVHPAFLTRDLDGDLDGVTKSPSKSRELEVLQLCLMPQGRRELQTALGLKHARSLRQRYLLQLIARGLLELTIPEKPTSQLQKYRTTAKGRAFLNDIAESA